MRSDERRQAAKPNPDHHEGTSRDQEFVG